MNKYAKYYSIVSDIKKLNDGLTEEIKTIKDTNATLDAISTLASFSVKYNAGYWANGYIENTLVNIAQSIDIENYDVDYIPNSFLHVMTTGYNCGGHTRVVERWIQNSPATESHSVLFTNYENFDTTILENSTKEKNGKIIFLDNSDSFIKKALNLRSIGLKYQYIILHTHMDDIIPSLAFGTEKFSRPVLLYNHASHLFWVGIRIADIILDLKKEDKITKIHKNIKKSYTLGIPSEEISFSSNNKQELRKKLKLPLDKKIIVTSGNESKFCTFADDTFPNVLNNIIDDNTYCYIIGLSPKNKQWKKYIKISNGHIIPLGYVDFHSGYKDFIAAADLYLDSYPLCGGTSVIDAISLGVPVLSLKSIYSQFDYFTCTEAYCASVSDFIKKSEKILTDKKFAEHIVTILQESLCKHQNKTAWTNKINELKKIIPQKHSIKELDEKSIPNIIDDLAVFTNFMSENNFMSKLSCLNYILKHNPKYLIKYGILYKRQGIPFIFEILSFKKSNMRRKVVKIFNFTVFQYTK